MTIAATTSEAPRAAWKLNWLTPMRCRVILVLLLGFGAFSHVRYLNDNCPADLSGDEAQYWDWSRQLDLSYYSKGPLVAYIIRASCAIFGNTMPAVRYPALALGVGTSIITYLLTRKFFKSEKLALGAVLLFHFVPMFIAGSVLMTIDPPMFFCWALATLLAAYAIFDERKGLWIAVGIAIGFGFLAKYSTFLWFAGLFGFLLVHDRRHLKNAMIAPLISSLFAIPVIVWNSRHNWVSLRHVAKQTGASQGGFAFKNIVEMVGTQFGVIGPTIAVLMIAAIGFVIFKPSAFNRDDRPKLLLLVWIGLSFWAFNLLASFRAKVEPNWPAPTYFSLMIVTACFIATRMRDVRIWKWWRPWLYATVVLGLMVMPISHDPSLIFPLVRRLAGPKVNLARFDLLARLRGWKGLGEYVSDQLDELSPGAFVIGHEYQQTAEMAFYVRGHPVTYCAGSYLGMRQSQYDMWPDRRLDTTSALVGHDAVYVSRLATMPAELTAAFDHVEPVHIYSVLAGTETVRVHGVWKCYGFKGLSTPVGQREY